MNPMFGLTKPELLALGTPEAQAELDRRAAKKAAKREVAVVSNGTGYVSPPEQSLEQRIEDVLLECELNQQERDQVHALINSFVAARLADDLEEQERLAQAGSEEAVMAGRQLEA